MTQSITVIPVGWRNKDKIAIPVDLCTSLSTLKAAIRSALGGEAHEKVMLRSNGTATN